MARRLVWSPEAVEDLESIASYISRDSAHYARSVVSRIVAAAESIPDNPHLGREVPELGSPAFRERFVHKFRVIYRVDADRVLVVAIIHGSRLLEALLQPNADGDRT